MCLGLESAPSPPLCLAFFPSCWIGMKGWERGVGEAGALRMPQSWWGTGALALQVFRADLSLGALWRVLRRAPHTPFPASLTCSSLAVGGWAPLYLIALGSSSPWVGEVSTCQLLLVGAPLPSRFWQNWACTGCTWCSSLSILQSKQVTALNSNSSGISQTPAHCDLQAPKVTREVFQVVQVKFLSLVLE